MKILVIGSGGREHAIAWKLAQNKEVEKVYVAPGNGGTYDEEKCGNVNIVDIDELIKFSKENNIDLTVVGPEDPLTKGIVDKFKEEGLKIFGPSQKAANLEGSKAFAKEFMKKYGVKTAAYETFDDSDKAIEYLNTCDYPVVIKADGLAAGKGVVIAKSFEEAKNTIISFMIDDIFKGASNTVVIEEFLEGVEASILSITDGNTILPFISAKDHKQIFDGDEGPNTGGMGVIAPNPYVTEEILKAFKEEIMEPTLKGIKSENMDYRGIIFFGIMITRKGVYLLEYNVRMGDPETQAVLSLMKSDLVDIIFASLNSKLEDFKLEWYDESALCIMTASEGYPSTYKKGRFISIENNLNGKVFISGAENSSEGLITSGGRVLSLVVKDKDRNNLLEKGYEEIKKISFEGMHYRRDIGKIN